jgi:molybdate transport system substrate-binding protein
MDSTLNVLSAGAAKGLVSAMQERFAEIHNATVNASFGAVGVMRDALLAGEPCDVMITSTSVLATLVAAGELSADMRSDIGQVHTGIAVRSGEMLPNISTAELLSASLVAAKAVYCTDLLRSTAGIHFSSVLKGLRIEETIGDRLRVFPNGATAMRELASTESTQLIGCAQTTEIIYTVGVDLVGVLPGSLDLVTVYTATASRTSPHLELASRFIAMLTGPEAHASRLAAGFES